MFKYTLSALKTPKEKAKQLDDFLSNAPAEELVEVFLYVQQHINLKAAFKKAEQ